MQEFKFHCPNCGQPIAADDSFCDQIVECPHCSNGFTVPPIQPPPKAPDISEVPRKTEQSTRKRWSKRKWISIGDTALGLSHKALRTMSISTANSNHMMMWNAVSFK